MNSPAAAPAAPAGSAAPTGAAPSSAAAAPAAMPERASNMTGTVIETMDASGYTYMNLKTANGDEWVAVPTTEKGDPVTVAGTTMIGRFRAPPSNRKFDRIGSAPSPRLPPRPLRPASPLSPTPRRSRPWRRSTPASRSRRSTLGRSR